MTLHSDAFDIVLAGDDDLPALRAHLERHFAESGRDGFYFMPFDPAHNDGPTGLTFDQCQLPVGTPLWERWFMARSRRDGSIVGHLDLKAYRLKTRAHRCQLGIGLEEAYRGLGLGRRLMLAAIDFASAQPTLDWIDLMVFAHNTRARALYQDLGFTEIGVTPDCFRIGGMSLDDVAMQLPLRR